MNVYLSSTLVQAERLEELRRAGFDGWEIIAEGPQKLNKDLVTLIDHAQSSYDLGISVHAPFSDLNIASLNGPIWRETIRQIEETIEGFSKNARIFVIHPGYISPLASLCPVRAIQKNREALKKIAHCADEYGVTATVENMVNEDFFLGRFPDEIADMRTDGLGFTLDVGHAHTTDALESFLRMSIDHIHLHDNNGKTDQHLTLGAGTIDWNRVVRALQRYKGIFVLESRTIDEGARSLAFLRRVTG